MKTSPPWLLPIYFVNRGKITDQLSIKTDEMQWTWNPFKENQKVKINAAFCIR